MVGVETLLKEEVEEPVFWKSIPGAVGGGGREEVDGDGDGSGEPGTLAGTEGRRLANRSSNELAAMGVAMEEGERGGRGWDSNSVIEGKWLLNDRSCSSWSSGASSMEDGMGGGGGFEEAAILEVERDAGLEEMGGGE